MRINRFLLYPMRSMGESIGIGLEASSPSKGSQAKTTEPMDSIKVTYCTIPFGWILARDGFAENYMGSRPEAKKCHFYFIQCEAWVESIGIGLAARSTSKGPQAKTTEHMESIKVTYCSIQLGCILARGGFSKNYVGSRPEAKKCHFSFSACGWMDGCYRFFCPRFFPHRWTDWNEIENLSLV